MPSSPNYVRDYKQERKTELARGGRRKHTLRLRARRLMMKKGMVKPHDGKHVNHVNPLSKTTGMSQGPLTVKSEKENVSYARTSSGAMKAKKS